MPVQTISKTPEDTFHSFPYLTDDSPLVPSGLIVSGYDFKIKEVRGSYSYSRSIHSIYYSHQQIDLYASIVMVFMIYFILDMQRH